MFAVLDSDHFREAAFGTPLGLRVRRKAEASGAEVFTTIITVQEAVQGWLAEINRAPAGRDQIRAYSQFQRTVSAFADLSILPFDDEAADAFHRLKDQRIRVGTMDLKIAAICIAHDMTLLTRNLGDFEKVPGLRMENWLD